MISSSSSSSSCCCGGGGSSSSSSNSTQRSARGTVDEMHVFLFKKKVFSPRPEATCQVYFNATTHI